MNVFVPSTGIHELEFNSSDEFFECKKEEERKTCTYYRRERSKKPTQGCSTILVCITLTALA